MSLWYEKEPQYTENTNCPICGKELSKCDNIVQLVGISEFYKIFTCSEEHKKELIRQIWKLSKQKDRGESNENEKVELEKMCRTLHLDKLYMLNQTLGSIKNSDYNLLDEETKQLASKLYDALSEKLSQIG